MGCKGICIRYKYAGNNREGLYQNSVKRCQICEIYIVYDSGNRCPCCNGKMRTRAHRYPKR